MKIRLGFFLGFLSHLDRHPVLNRCSVEDSQASSHTGPGGKELRQLYLALAENK
jgi:hypothetical protein